MGGFEIFEIPVVIVKDNICVIFGKVNNKVAVGESFLRGAQEIASSLQALRAGIRPARVRAFQGGVRGCRNRLSFSAMPRMPA